MRTVEAPQRAPVISSGIAGLDELLCGGWPEGRIFLVIGDPGAGKTTLGLQFLLEGAAQGESTLYISMSETSAEVMQVARGHGWNLESVSIFDLSAAERLLGLEDEQTVFAPSEVELRETTRAIIRQIERVRPRRIVFDSLAELYLLADDPLQFRREILQFKTCVLAHNATALMLSDSTMKEADRQVQSIAHGVVNMEQRAPEYGTDRRRLRICKLRATNFRGGYHDYRIQTGGLVVYPRLVASEHHQRSARKPLSSGLAGLDQLTHGGLNRGNSVLIMGPAGSGKSSVLAHYVSAALKNGESAAVYLFDEGIDSFLRRSEALNLPLRKYITDRKLVVRQIDPAEVSPGEFAHSIRDEVEKNDATVVGIDSLNGYIYAMPEERFLALHLHELLSYLNQRGVIAILLLAQHGLVGDSGTPINLTYVADSTLLLRFFEAKGRIRRALSMVKKRSGTHEETIRELRLAEGGLEVGDVLEHFQGLLTGVPVFGGESLQPTGDQYNR